MLNNWSLILMTFISSLFKIALPIILQNFLSSFVNMLDTIMVGQLGSIDIAAVGLANQVFFVMNIMMFGIVSGGSIFISQYWGKKDLKGIHRTMGIMLSMTFIVSLIFFLLATFIPELCLKIYSDDLAVIERGAKYLRTVAPSYLFTGIGIAIGHSARSTERVQLPMYATGLSVIINGLLNYALIFGITICGIKIFPELGIIGAAIATDIARIIELLILLIVPYLKKYEIAVTPKIYFSKEKGFISHYVKIALPVLINESLWGIGTSLQSSIFGHAGTDVVAASNITSTISNLIWTFFIGCGNAAAIMIGKKIGQQLYDEAKKLAKKLTYFMIGSAAVLSLLLIPLAFLLKHFFKVEPEVIHMAQIFLFITVVLYPLWAINMVVVVGVCRSGGDTVFALFLDIGFMWIISLPLGFCAVKFWSFPFWAIFLCIHTEDVFKAVLGLIRMKSGKWLHDVTQSAKN